jgi:Fic-DOC domain mobile mystery protein B
MIDSTSPGNTPLDPDEAEGLLPGHITSRDELNQAEEANILEAMKWATSRKHSDLLTDSFIRKLHRRMFKDVWRWAGSYRNSLKNIGIPPEQISVEVKKLCEDVKYWIESKTYGWEELGVRYHHRLVSIHPFSNGNGRHARLMTDLIFKAYGQEPFSWGANSPDGEIGPTGSTHDRYLEALQAADNHDFGPLLIFVRS